MAEHEQVTTATRKRASTGTNRCRRHHDGLLSVHTAWGLPVLILLAVSCNICCGRGHAAVPSLMHDYYVHIRPSAASTLCAGTCYLALHVGAVGYLLEVYGHVLEPIVATCGS